MRDGTRAAVSAALLTGFLVVAWLQVLAALLLVVLVLWLLPGSVAVQVAVPLTIATGGLLWYATVRALRLRHRPPAGVPVTRRDAPQLWAMIDEASAASGVAPPHGVTVVAEATAVLAEQLRFGGLRGGRRDLLLGLPLLLAWDDARVRAVVAHELAHGSPRLSRFAPMARRGRVALSRIVPRIPRRSPAGPLLRAYARWYRSVDAPFSRAQELAADRVAASFAGPRAATAVLLDEPALDGMQQLFHAEYLSPGWQAGYVPDDVFGGLLRVLAARADEVARLRAADPEPPGEWDPHPPVSERLAALTAEGADSSESGAESAPADSPAPEGEPVSSGDLVPDLPALGRALQAVAFPPAGRTVVSWDEFFGVARIAEMEREADASLRALSRVAGRPVTGAGEVLDLAADGQLRKIAETMFAGATAEQTAERISDLLTLLFALAALASGAARWRHSWSGSAELVAFDGSHLDLAGPAALAADPATVDTAREWLAGLGIDLTATAGPGERRLARVPVLGGVVNMLVDGARTDLLVVETGLVLVPGLPRSRYGEAKRRLTRLAAEGVLADGSSAGDRPPPIPRQPTASPTAAGDAASAPAGDATLTPAGGATFASAGDAAQVPAGDADLAPAGAGVAGASGGGAAAAGSASTPAAEAAGASTAGITTAADPAEAASGASVGVGVGVDSRRWFVPFADVKTATVVRNGRRGWEISLHDGRTLSVRTALDSDELPGGWAALDDAVAFLARTR
ncbi:MAG: M48 family metalloprotease [Actinoplanes sp.]